MATLSITVKESDATTNREGVVVRAYSVVDRSLIASDTTDSSGAASLVVADGDYWIHLYPEFDRTYAPQWVGEQNVGVFDMSQAHTIVVSGNASLTLYLASDINLFGEDVNQPPYAWWIDRSNSDALVPLLPGDERRPFNGDKLDELYRHVLQGPYISKAAATAAI